MALRRLSKDHAAKLQAGRRRALELHGVSQKNREAARTVGKANARHGMSKTRLHRTWRFMRQRCFNPRASNFHYYGGRGITICEEWLTFENFCAWAMASGYTDQLTIDRIDSDGNYEPDNCRWVTTAEQNRNRTFGRGRLGTS